MTSKQPEPLPDVVIELARSASKKTTSEMTMVEAAALKLVLEKINSPEVGGRVVIVELGPPLDRRGEEDEAPGPPDPVQLAIETLVGVYVDLQLPGVPDPVKDIFKWALAESLRIRSAGEGSDKPQWDFDWMAEVGRPELDELIKKEKERIQVGTGGGVIVELTGDSEEPSETARRIEKEALLEIQRRWDGLMGARNVYEQERGDFEAGKHGIKGKAEQEIQNRWNGLMGSQNGIERRIKRFDTTAAPGIRNRAEREIQNRWDGLMGRQHGVQRRIDEWHSAKSGMEHAGTSPADIQAVWDGLMGESGAVKAEVAAFGSVKGGIRNQAKAEIRNRRAGLSGIRNRVQQDVANFNSVKHGIMNQADAEIQQRWDALMGKRNMLQGAMDEFSSAQHGILNEARAKADPYWEQAGGRPGAQWGEDDPFDPSSASWSENQDEEWATGEIIYFDAKNNEVDRIEMDWGMEIEAPQH